MGAQMTLISAKVILTIQFGLSGPWPGWCQWWWPLSRRSMGYERTCWCPLNCCSFLFFSFFHLLLLVGSNWPKLKPTTGTTHVIWAPRTWPLLLCLRLFVKGEENGMKTPFLAPSLCVCQYQRKVLYHCCLIARRRGWVEGSGSTGNGFLSGDGLLWYLMCKTEMLAGVQQSRWQWWWLRVATSTGCWQRQWWWQRWEAPHTSSLTFLLSFFLFFSLL